MYVVLYEVGGCVLGAADGSGSNSHLHGIEQYRRTGVDRGGPQYLHLKRLFELSRAMWSSRLRPAGIRGCMPTVSDDVG
jgi:hypothetical protein